MIQKYVQGVNLNVLFFLLIDINFRGSVYIVQDNKVLCENVTGFAGLANEVSQKEKKNL